MVFKLGTEILENKEVYEDDVEKLVDKVLTTSEKTIYFNKKGRKQIEFLCGRIALKKAVIKVLEDYESPNMLEIEVLNNFTNKPYVRYKQYKLSVTISYEKERTIAQVVFKK